MLIVEVKTVTFRDLTPTHRIRHARNQPRRPNTERPVTITHGTNRLVPCEYGALVEMAKSVLNGGAVRSRERPPLWDGRAAERIVEVFRAGGYVS